MKLCNLSLAFAVAGSICGADPIQLDGKPFSCSDAEPECQKSLDTIRRLHWKKHQVEAEASIQEQRLQSAIRIKKIALEKRLTEQALRDVAIARKEAVLQVALEKQANLEKNLPGLKFLTAELISNDEAPASCDALPYVRYKCALRAECADTDAQPCPGKLDCALPLDGQSVCYLPPAAKEPYEIKIEYSCLGKKDVTETFSSRSKFAYFSCDLR